MNRLRHSVCSILLSTAIALTACGGGSDATAPGAGTPNAGQSSGSSASSAPASAPEASAAASLTLPFRFGKQIIASRLPHVAIDAAGGVHAVYAANAADEQGRRPAFYSYCASDCNSTGRFTTVALGDGLGDAQIQLTPAGQPRILLATQPRATNAIQHEFWSCDHDCLQAGGWTRTVVVEAGAPFFPSDSETTQSFALDSRGRPRFFFQSNAMAGSSELGGAYLAACDARCETASQWRLMLLDENLWKNVALTIDPQGLPRIAFSIVEPVEPYLPVLSYLECSSEDCGVGARRVRLAVTTTAGPLSTSTFAMRLTTSGAPRIALYTGTGEGGELTANQLFYLSCDDSCAAQRDSWRMLNLGLPATQAEQGVDLVLDRQNRPRIALRVPVPVDELAYAWCDDASCETAAQAWHSQLLPSAQAARAEMGLPLAMGCPECLPPIPPCPTAYWQAGFWPSLTLDRRGNPVVAYEVQLQAGGGACSVGVLARVPRLISFEQPH